MILWRRSLDSIGISFGIIIVLGLLGKAAAQSSPQEEWDKTVQAAKKEGRLTVYGSSAHEKLYRLFNKEYPEIKVTYVSGRGSENGPRILRERRAKKYIVDLYVAGIHTPYKLLYRSKALDPVPPSLMLPEVLDQSKWWRGKHHYADDVGRYIFIFEGTVQSGGIAYNKNLVDPKRFKSFWDVLDSEWRGKGVALHPKSRGMISQALTFFYHNPKLGPDFIKRLYSEMDLTISRNDRQMVDWLGAGKFQFSFFARGVGTAEVQGLPVQQFYAGTFKEGAFINPLNGSVSLMNQASHPNAAKLAMNWILSRRGQLGFQKVTKERSGRGANSMREDISKEDVHFSQRRVKGVDYLFTARPEWMDMSAISELAFKAWSGSKKK